MNTSPIFLLMFITQVTSSNVSLDNIVEFIESKLDTIKVENLKINKMCALQLEILLNRRDILLQMIDASAKLPYAGMLDSGRIELGNFDECISIDHNINGVNIMGKYCYAGLVIPDITNISNVDMFFKLATCIPAACTAEDLLNISSTVFFQEFPPIFIDDFCTTKETGKEVTIENILVICLIFLLMSLVLLSTLYEFYCHKMNEKPAHHFLLSFSVISNTKSLLNSQQSKETIQIFNGFRSISLAWIIAGHGVQFFETGLFATMNNRRVVEVQYSRVASYLYGATFSVTTFFFMSGFLVSYIYFKNKPDHWLDQVKCIPKLYLYRYIRLTASLLMIYLLVLYVFDKIGNGPIWHTGIQTEIGFCKKYWWSYFLYIQNYVNYNEMCLIPLWYLSADMQLFLLTPLVLIPISVILKRPDGFKMAMLLLASLIAVFVLLNIGNREFFSKTDYEKDFFTHDRLAEYFIGIMMGLFMRLKKEEPFLGTLNRDLVSVINILGWISVMIPMLSLVIFSSDYMTLFQGIDDTLYRGFGRVIWATGLSWMVYSCYHGYGGVINWILCRPIFQVLGKLSYSMYLLHYLVLGHYAFSNRMKWYFSHYVQFYLFCGAYIETLLISFIWSLGLESPILKIEKQIFKHLEKPEVAPSNNIKSPQSIA